MTTSFDVEELKAILKSSEQDPSLLTSIRHTNLRQRCSPNAYFAFPGTKGSMISLPPLQKWPIQLGWSFSTWFFLDPKANAQPYLYNFKTGKSGLGYSAHFFNNCLVLTSIRVKGKGVQHCVAYEFPSHKWIHCAVTYHNKWRASEIKVYVNGQMTANIEMQWQVQTSEIFDKCFIGGSGSITKTERAGDLTNLSGQMSAMYLFNEGLSPNQICAIHRLGPSYMGQFKYSNESHVNLPSQISKTLYDEKLASSLFCLFTPVAVDSGTLCIQLAPFKSSTSASAPNYFLSAPHAALQGETKAVITQPVCSTLQSLGCSRALLPLLESYCKKGDSKACESLIGFLCDLLESSPHWFANEIVQSNGFVIVASSLAANSRPLLTEKLLDTFLNLTRTLMTTASSHGDSLLLKNLLDNILFNPSLWVYAEPDVQIKLYKYLSSEFLHGTRPSPKYAVAGSASSTPYVAYSLASAGGGYVAQNYATNSTSSEEQPKSGSFEGSLIVADLLFGEMRRVSTVLQSLHSLKYYYWLVEEDDVKHKARNAKLRPGRQELVVIRAHILKFITELITRANTCPSDEIQGMLNYISACSQPENILDVMDTLSELISRQSAAIVLALDQKQAIRVLFTLVGAKDKRICVNSLRLLNLFLSRCSYKKKHDIMNPHNLFMLLCDRLRCHLPLSLDIYEALVDLMIEEHQPDRLLDDKRPRELSKKSIVNSAVVKVIATLIQEQRSVRSKDLRTLSVESSSSRVTDIRSVFINDLWNLIVNSRENRRIILQMSVWQHWLINLIGSTLEDSPLFKDQVLAVFRVLLYHAVRYEFGGWRVWIDTLAIIHAKVSYDEFCRQHEQNSPNNSMSELRSRKHEEDSKDSAEDRKPSSGPSSAIKEAKKDEASPHQANEKAETEDAPKPMNVSSISEHIVNESRGIEIPEDSSDKSIEPANVDEPDVGSDTVDKEATTPDVNMNNESDSGKAETKTDEGSMDSVDLAPSRAYRQKAQTLGEPEEDDVTETAENETDRTNEVNEVSRQLSMTSIPLEDPPTLSDAEKEPELRDNGHVKDGRAELDRNGSSDSRRANDTPKAKASPVFRIPEFRWGNVLVKLLNDLIFSIECDLYHWRCSAKLANLDCAPFVPKTANQTATNQSATGSGSTANPATSTNETVENILHRPENQIYIINVVHLVSQLADNVVIAAGGLLPLLADATGGTRGSPSIAIEPASSTMTSEGLTLAQANSLLYRLVSMIDMVVFAASHINLGELESDKNTTNGGILRQCLRLTCTVTVKNCLVLRALANKIASMGIGGGEICLTAVEMPKDMFDAYMGCSLLSANGLFEQSALALEDTDLIANLEYSPHQNPNTSSMPPILPFQSSPIKDPNKLLQMIDIQRIQACIYHNNSPESRQSQFLALSSLYFISVLMVSKYRDIIEPKQKAPHKHAKAGSRHGSPAPSSSGPSESSPVAGESSAQTNNNEPAVSSIEAGLMNFGNMQPNCLNPQQPAATTNNLTNMLTTKLEVTLDTICPLLKSIMCDFCAFLSKTLIGSHGQDLVNKEADRTFKRADASPVEVVMLLCSQEWQNTLQKNAGLAFIELINEGRVLSAGMKDHIVRVAMEADFILSRLRADDVSKHDHFGLACSESISARLHEEILINSLISSAARRDHMLFRRFKEMMQEKDRGHYKLDIWEDDDRRKRRFVFDSWDDTKQILYSDKSREHDNRSPETNEQSVEKADTKRILELQKTIELGCIDDHCSPAGTVNPHGELGHDSDISNYDDEDDDDNQTTSQISDEGQQSRKPRQKSEHSDMKIKGKEANGSYLDKNRASNHESAGNNASLKDHHMTDDLEAQSSKEAENIWDYEECASVSDFTGSVVFAAEASLVWSIYAIPGVLQISTSEVHFEPNQNIAEAIDSLRNEPSKSQQVDGGCDATDETFSQSLRCNQNDPSTEQISLRKIDLKALRYCDFLTCNGKILLSDIRAIFSRHYLLQPNALEIFMSQRTSVMFAFNDFEIVKRVVKYLPPVGVGIKYGIPQSRRASLMSPRQLFAASNMTQRWQKREIGNFQYLMFLNTISGRTLQDLNQYPVFPWILTDYESDKLDLNLPKNFRDLSKPIGALNNKRRKEFVERYQSWDNPKVPAFHYGTHYSTAAFTLNWLSRMRGTYNASYLALQDGKYEEKSRLFLSLGDSWVSSLSGGQQNVKELIPEFFYLPEIFHANLGLPEVELPPWAKSAEEFVRVHRIALESELVSCQLHQWIDLIFGFKQRGPEAINAVNTFYYLTYQGNVNLNMIQDASLRDAIETQIKHFGQTPSQLTTEPHPPRFSALHASPLMYSSRVDEVNKVVKFPFNNPVVHISSCINNYIAATAAGDTTNSIGTVAGSSATSSPSSILTITSNNQYQIHKWMPDDQSGHPFTIDPQLEGPAATNSAARRQLIDVEDICSGIQLKLSSSADDEAAEQQLQSLSNSAEEVQWQCAHYIVTLNGKYIIMGSFYDYSFRVFTTESGKLCQVIYGHRGPITCIAKSEGNASADFYIATGGQDCSLLIWTWNDRYAQVEGSGVSAVHNPLPKLSLCGHLSPVLSAMICSELGLIASGSRNLVLVHNITSGENLLNISIKLPDIMENTLREHRQLHTPDGSSAIQRPQVADKEKTILEASMLGEGSSKLASDKPSSASSGNESPSGDRLKEERLAQLKNLCHSDYYITNLQLARELAFIVCVALPPPPPCRKRSKSSGDYDSSGSPPALLLTFNLMGSLMDSTPISQSTASSPKLGDVCVMQLTRDGEHLVLNDSPVTIKIYKTFGLQPLYSYSTNDIPDALSEDHNRVRSLALLDRKYILVGLDNGKIIVYNCDFRNLQ